MRRTPIRRSGSFSKAAGCVHDTDTTAQSRANPVRTAHHAGGSFHTLKGSGRMVFFKIILSGCLPSRDE